MSPKITQNNKKLSSHIIPIRNMPQTSPNKVARWPLEANCNALPLAGSTDNSKGRLQVAKVKALARTIPQPWWIDNPKRKREAKQTRHRNVHQFSLDKCEGLWLNYYLPSLKYPKTSKNNSSAWGAAGFCATATATISASARCSGSIWPWAEVCWGDQQKH